MEGTKLQKEIRRREEANNLAPFPVYDTEVIHDLKILKKMKLKPNYDSEKIHYCKTCLSIALKTVTIPSPGNKEDAEITYCLHCGNTETEVAQDIYEWQDIYEEKYGEKFLTEKKEKRRVTMNTKDILDKDKWENETYLETIGSTSKKYLEKKATENHLIIDEINKFLIGEKFVIKTILIEEKKDSYYILETHVNHYEDKEEYKRKTNSHQQKRNF